MEQWELIDELACEARRLHIDLGLTFPVDIPDVCEYLGIQYHEEYMPKLVDGMYWISDVGTPHVAINKRTDRTPGRRRFSGGHEIGHHLAHQRAPTERIFFLDAANEDRQPIEHVCNTFSANMLMPVGAFMRAYREQATHGNVANALARIFGVTPAAVRVRLRECGVSP